MNPTELAAPCGTVHGSLERGVHVFRGIAYALPPVGSLRFAPPQPAPPVQHIDATRFGAISLQDIDPLPEVLPGAEHNFYATGSRTDEDCLTLNVWTADPAGAAPVYVYIHGGGFLCGSGTGDWIDGANLARELGIVVVTVNYRLGLLGNLWLGDHDPMASNLAIQDDIQALRWVRDNIAAFGGDPSNVTVGGESAGALSTLALLCAPAAQGLFQRAVVESGHLGLFQSVLDARRATEIVLRDLHIDARDDVLARLRETSTLRIAAVQRRHGIALGCFPLVADGTIIDADPVRALGAGWARDVALLIGSNAEEDRLFRLTGWAPPTRSVAEAADALLTSEDARGTAIRLYEGVQAEGQLGTGEIDSLMATDQAWAEPVRATALAHGSAGGRTYHYQLGWRSSVPGVGAAHLVDVPFFFGNLEQPGVTALLGDEVRTDPATRVLASATSASLAQFVRTGDLAHGPLGPWPTYTESERWTMVLDRRSHLERDNLADRLDFWAAHRDEAASPLASTTGGLQ
ncbi:carboxylesterase family protein [soil metagenome]